MSASSLEQKRFAKQTYLMEDLVMSLGIFDLAVLSRLVWVERSETSFSWARVLRRYEFLMARARQRRELLELSDERLQDVGISRSAAEREGRKGFWQD